jgi:omega-hydroxy-beta-dihydromenaquinone-9 sulfotransferase
MIEMPAIEARATDHVSAAYRKWTFRIWHGMTLKAWWHLLVRNRFAIAPSRLPMVIDISLCAFMNSLCGVIQQIVYGRRIDLTSITVPPVFIIGHWRTGTTWLHEMLALDTRFVAPTSYECFAPSHALLTAPIWTLSRFRAPKLRPMDGMPVGYERPQEDEFALLNLGERSFLETLAFPNHRPVAADYIGLTKLPCEQASRWTATRSRFFKQVLYRGRRDARRQGRDGSALRLLLKSPQDTARLRILSRLFPDACFIHLVRNPQDVFASTVKLWTVLGQSQALHKPDWRERPDGTKSLESFVLTTLEQLYENFEASRQEIRAAQFIDVRYEDLTRDPIGELRRVYAHFGWTDFETMVPRFLTYLRESNIRGGHSYRLPDRTRIEIARRWRDYRVSFGYATKAESDGRAA